MLSYLRCIKSHRGTNDPECRNLSKSYLSCRMDRYVHQAYLFSGYVLRLPITYIATHFLPLPVPEQATDMTMVSSHYQIIPTAPESVAYTRFCPAPSFAFDERITDHSCAYRNLMAPDSFRNLGFGDDSDGPGSKNHTTTSSQTSQK